MDLEADDEVRRVDLRYLGPQGMTLPFAARYTAYALFGAVETVVLVLIGVLPVLHLSVTTFVWGSCAAAGVTYWLMQSVDHEVPLRSITRTLTEEATIRRPRADRATTTTYRTRRIRVRR